VNRKSKTYIVVLAEILGIILPLLLGVAFLVLAERKVMAFPEIIERKSVHEPMQTGLPYFFNLLFDFLANLFCLLQGGEEVFCMDHTNPSYEDFTAGMEAPPQDVPPQVVVVSTEVFHQVRTVRPDCIPSLQLLLYYLQHDSNNNEWMAYVLNELLRTPPDVLGEKINSFVKMEMCGSRKRQISSLLQLLLVENGGLQVSLERVTGIVTEILELNRAEFHEPCLHNLLNEILIQGEHSAFYQRVLNSRPTRFHYSRAAVRWDSCGSC
jgi:hypothetical protein